MSIKKRRRVVRRSEAEYDRLADRKAPPTSADEERRVILDEEDDGGGERDRDFYLEQRPPHYGA